MTVVPHAAYFPDFLTPTLDVPDTVIEVVLSTPPRRLREELGQFQPTGSSEVGRLDELTCMAGQPHAVATRSPGP